MGKSCFKRFFSSIYCCAFFSLQGPGYSETVIHLKLDGNLTDSAGDHDASLFGSGAVLTTSRFGIDAFGREAAAYLIDDRSVSLELAHSETLDLSGDHTVSLWVKTTANEEQVMLYKGDPNSFINGSWQFNLFGDRGMFVFQGGAGALGHSWESTEGIRIHDGQWHHVALVYQKRSNTHQTLYIDAIGKTSRDSESRDPWLNTDFVVQTQRDGSILRVGAREPSYGAVFNGWIDDIQVYDRALDAEEIAFLADVTNLGRKLADSARIPFIQHHPFPDKIITIGDSLVLEVKARADDMVSYQWQYNGEDIAGATESVLILNPVSFKNVGTYSAVVSTSGGSIVSQPSKVTVTGPPLLRLDESSRIRLEGERGKRYEVQYTDNLAEPIEWQPVSHLTLNGYTAMVVDDTDVASTTRFYRAISGLAGPGNSVSVRSSDENNFEVRSGAYRIRYDQAQNGLVLIGKEGAKKQIFLNFGFDDLPLLASDLIRDIAVLEDSDTIEVAVQSELPWAGFQTRFIFYKEKPGLLHWTVDLEAADNSISPTQWRQVGDFKPELGFYDIGAKKFTSSKAVNLLAGTPQPNWVDPGRGHLSEERSTSAASTKDRYGGSCFFWDAESSGSMVLYHADYGSLNDYYELTNTSPDYLPGIREQRTQTAPWNSTDRDGDFFIERFGYVIPGPRRWISANTEVRIVDSYLYLWPEKTSKPTEYCALFLRLFAEVYNRLPKPGTIYTEWRDVAPDTIRRILEPTNWKTVGPFSYLQAFSHDERAVADHLVLQQILVPLTQYLRKYQDPEGRRLAKKLKLRVPDFFQPQFVPGSGAIGYPKPPLPDIWHPWAFLFPYTQVGDLALLGDQSAAEILKASAPLIIDLARGLDYQFYFLVNVKKISIVDNGVNRGYQYDATGEYAYLMLQYYELTGASVYLEEARRAVEKIGEVGFELAYELGVTAMAADACLWLYALTGEEKYKQISYIPMANLIRHSWVWECDFGLARDYQTFFGTSATPTSRFFAGHEETWIIRHLHDYYRRGGENLPENIKMIIAEMLKYKITTARSTFPAFLPVRALSRNPEFGVIRPSWAIPLEGVMCGREASGHTGQQIYGAGLSILLADLLYNNFASNRFGLVTLYSEYPVVKSSWDNQKNTLEFQVGGNQKYDFEARVFIEHTFNSAKVWRTAEDGTKIPLHVAKEGSSVIFRAHGAGIYQVELISVAP